MIFAALVLRWSRKIMVYKHIFDNRIQVWIIDLNFGCTWISLLNLTGYLIRQWYSKWFWYNKNSVFKIHEQRIIQFYKSITSFLHVFDNKEKCRNSETEKRLEFITGYNITKGYPLLQDSVLLKTYCCYRNHSLLSFKK